MQVVRALSAQCISGGSHKFDQGKTIKNDRDILNDTSRLAACGQHAVKCQKHLRFFSKNQIRRLHTQIVYILTLRLAELNEIHTHWTHHSLA